LLHRCTIFVNVTPHLIGVTYDTMKSGKSYNHLRTHVEALHLG